MRLVQAIQLFFQEGTSDKVYHAELREIAPGAYDVEVAWGRRGAALQKGKKAVKVPLAAAQRTFDGLVRDKTRKGYEIVSEESAPKEVAPPIGEGSGSRAKGARRTVGVRAQLLNPVDPDGVNALLDDAIHLAQQKLDGSRVLVHLTHEGPLATNRAGQATRIAQAILDGLAELPPGTIVDGEVVVGDDGATYWLFDVLAFGARELAAEPYARRYEVLFDEIDPGLSGPVRVVDTARAPEEKRALFERLRAARAEGIVFKRADAPHAEGRPASRGPQLKHKFVQSADVVLIENAGNAYRMQLRDGRGSGGRWRDVGKVFSGTTNESRALLDRRLSDGERVVAEVQYLYATDDDQLFQPVLVRLRDDKEPDDCRLSQLQRTNRAVL